LGEVAGISRGRFSPRPRNNPIYYNGDIPFVQTGDVVHSNGVINQYSQTLNEKGLEVSRLFPKGTILITIAANIGYSGVLEIDMACPDSLIGLNCKKNCHNWFLNYLLFIEQKKMDYLAIAAAQKNINIEFLKPYKFHLPSLAEQEKIASFLGSVDSKLQQLKKKKALFEDYKKGSMQKIFSQEIRFKDDNGNDYPKWEKKKLGDVADDIMYGMNAAAKRYDGTNKYLRITDIDENSRTFLPNPLSSPEGKIEKKYILKEGDIVFARTGASVGKSYLYNPLDGKLLFAGFLIKFSLKKNNPYFIYCQTLMYSYLKWVNLMSMRSGQPGINAEEYKILPIHLPSLPEQEKIANFLSAIDRKIGSIDKQIEQTETYKKSLLQQMFYS
jgi:type I restriction enzyme S subunit